MPNWCEGTLRLRGKRKDIVAFLKDNLRCVGHDLNSLDTVDWAVNVKEEDDGQSITVCCKDGNDDNITYNDWLWIKDTCRNFIVQNPIYIDMYGSEDKTYTVCIGGLNAAWGIEPEPYISFSNKYGLDIKIFGSEQGMQFEQCIEIINGELLKDEEYRYEDWDWEAVNPHMGG